MALVALGAAIFCGPAKAQETLIPNGAQWRWSKGTNEVSNPIAAWRTNGFDDSAWLVGTAPFHFGTNSSGGDDSVVTGTILNGMSNSYSCVFLRNYFTVTNAAEVASLQMTALCDDGFIAWINGVEVLRTNVTGQPLYTTLANSAREASTPITILATVSPQSCLVTGTNVLAVQAFNVAIADSDFRFDAALQMTKRPVILTTTPAAGATLGTLMQITVVFNEAVYGVDASDLLVNGQPAASVSAVTGTNTYTFTFTQPEPGPVVVTWDDTSAISDASGIAFNTEGPTATWSYTLTDTVAPQIGQLTPVAGAQVQPADTGGSDVQRTGRRRGRGRPVDKLATGNERDRV